MLLFLLWFVCAPIPRMFFFYCMIFWCFCLYISTQMKTISCLPTELTDSDYESSENVLFLDFTLSSSNYLLWDISSQNLQKWLYTASSLTATIRPYNAYWETRNWIKSMRLFRRAFFFLILKKKTSFDIGDFLSKETTDDLFLVLSMQKWLSKGYMQYSVTKHYCQLFLFSSLFSTASDYQNRHSVWNRLITLCPVFLIFTVYWAAIDLEIP